MFDFFSKILGFIETVFEFFINLVESLFKVFEVLMQAIEVPVQLLVFLPSFLGSALIIAVSIGVIKFIIGR